MPAQNIFIAHPKNNQQINALKAIVKAFDIDFEITNKKNNSEIIEELKNSLNQVKALKSGKIQKQSVKDFLDEL